jgi:ABC-type antimicrobial peptide transport system permease subunit
MRELVDASLFDRRLELGLLGAFAVLALVLAAAGIYGVMAYAVAQRTQEFGIRVALGASGGDLVRLVVGQGLRMTAAGVLVGLAAAWVGASVLSTLLYDVSTRDPIVFGGTAMVLTVVALAACLVPAWRALTLSPLAALRAE